MSMTSRSVLDFLPDIHGPLVVSGKRSEQKAEGDGRSRRLLVPGRTDVTALREISSKISPLISLLHTEPDRKPSISFDLYTLTVLGTFSHNVL